MSFVESRAIIFIFSRVPAWFEIANSTVLLILLVNRNVQYVDFVVNGMIDILLLLLQYKLFEVFRLSPFQLPQPILHSVVLLADLIDYLQ